MRIALIIRGLDRMGGVQRHVLELAKGLRKKGHDATIYTHAYDPGALYPELRNVAPVVVAKGAKELAARIAPTDILNPHDRAYDVAYFYKKMHRTPSVWTMHDLPTRAFSSMREAACRGERVGIVRRLIDRYRDAQEVMPYVRAQDAVAVLDERDRRWAQENFGKEAHVVRNGVDIERFDFVPRHVGQPVRLLMTGIFFPHRRFEDGIEAVRVLRERGIDATLTIIGAFDEQDPYYQKLPKNTWVKFLGRVSEEELARAYRESHIFLFPNILQSWGLAVFEALASGLPSVVSRSAGASEVLKDKETALLVEPFNPNALTGAIETLINDKTLYARLSAQGRALVEKLTWENTVITMEALFSAAVANGGDTTH